MTAPRIDTSHIKSPRDPMTAEEREAIRAEISAEMAWLDAVVAQHGDPWGGLRPDWYNADDDAA